ncbi:MAG: hypothetical protein HKM04_03025 [Legionellales bacterium]|nr:hypothetical protein [Legionellales bacterium]
MPNPGSVALYTWNSGSGKGRGYLRAAKSTFFGGNVGHAALEVTWPADEAGKALYKKYKTAEGVQIGQRTQFVSVKIAEDRYVREEQTVYYAYFSWWPGDVEHTRPHSIQTIDEDTHAEWRHQKGHIKREIKRAHYTPDNPVPMTTDTGVLASVTKKKNIEAGVEKIQHEAEPWSQTYESDPVWQQLQQKKAVLLDELAVLRNNADAWLQELVKEPELRNYALEPSNEEYEMISRIPRKVINLDDKIARFEKNFDSRHSLKGEPPSAIVLLPLKNPNDPQGLTHGLDLEDMLTKMQDLATNEEQYSLYKRNCTDTVREIINAGVSEEDELLLRESAGVGLRVSKIDAPMQIFNYGMKLQQGFQTLNAPPQPEINNRIDLI